MQVNNKILTHRRTRACEINVLIACEESQAECIAFRRLGCNAYSCDIQKPRYYPQWHISGDVTPYLDGCTSFITMDGQQHTVDHWDLIVAHPPCTYLCKVSSVRMVQNGKVNAERYTQMLQARDFFFKCLNAQADFVAVENPLPMARAQLPKPTTYTCPSQFGYKYTKKTLWWLKGLTPVMPTVFFPNPKCFVSASRGKYRSRTFPAVAEACARTWLNDILGTTQPPSCPR